MIPSSEGSLPSLLFGQLLVIESLIFLHRDADRAARDLYRGTNGHPPAGRPQVKAAIAAGPPRGHVLAHQLVVEMDVDGTEGFGRIAHGKTNSVGSVGDVGAELQIAGALDGVSIEIRAVLVVAEVNRPGVARHPTVFSGRSVLIVARQSGVTFSDRAVGLPAVKAPLGPQRGSGTGNNQGGCRAN